MHVVAVGLNHTTAPLALREAALINDERAVDLLREAALAPPFEAAILSTCNRTEAYVAAGGEAEAEAAAFRLFDAACGAERLRQALYEKVDREAARHLFAVAAGLDSLVVGESQVLGQVRQAYALAQAAGTAGPYIAQLFNQAVHAGKRVRAETPIGQGAASVSYAAVELARKIFGDLNGASVLLVGAGKMAELAAKNLAGRGIRRMVVANRSEEHAVRLARLVGGEPAGLEGLAGLVAAADIVITSTGSPRPLLTRADIEAAVRERQGRPLFLIDIAMPRDVDERAAEIDGVFLYNIDDLKDVVDANLHERERHIARAAAIVDEEADRFAVWMSERRAAPIIAALRQKVCETVEAEGERLIRRLGNLSDPEKEQIRAFARSVAGKILHEPTLKIKESAVEGNHEALFTLVGDLFDLDPAARRP